MASLAVGVGQAVSDEPPDAGDVREVQVLDQSDRPLAGATVTVSENPPSDLPEGASFTATVLFSGTTAESGEVNVVVPAVTDAGDVTVTVMKPGYTPSTEMLETADPQEARPAASLAGLAPRPKRVRLTLTRMERPAAKTGMSHARLNALPCYYAPSNYDYLNVQEFREDTRVGKAYSRSERGFVDMTYNRGGTSVLGVGSSADGKVAKSGATKPVQICGTRGGPGDPGQVVVVNP